jgi:hypothetical protein
MKNLLVAGVVIMLESKLQEDETMLVHHLYQVLFTVVINYFYLTLVARICLMYALGTYG